MKENKYDDEKFFHQYSRMARSIQGLSGAGEWHQLKKMLPSFEDKTVLDLGCGFGWHCVYAVENGARAVTGIDISEKMIRGAIERKTSAKIVYQCMAVEDFDYLPGMFDIVISSLTFHYLETFADIAQNVFRTLTKGGSFVFSIEHPVFTAYGTQDWYYDENGNRLHWPVDRYFTEGKRDAIFLGENITKYHKTLTTYMNALLEAGFAITGMVEPQPDNEMLDTVEGMKDELRRPMMLIISALKV